jgi:DNA-binding YbaB/EbfC family protein
MIPVCYKPDTGGKGAYHPMGFNMKALQQMQNKMMKMQEELQNSTFEGTSGGDAIKVSMTGKFEITSVKLDPEVVDPGDISMLEDLILAACQDAFAKATEATAKMMETLTGGIKLPPGF